MKNSGRINGKRRCPHCGSNQIARSRCRGALEKVVMRPLWLRPYRCLNCDQRHYAFASRKKPATGSAHVPTKQPA